MKEICCRKAAHHVEKTTDYTDDYKKLISLMVGCHYVFFDDTVDDNETIANFPSKSDRDSKKTSETTERMVSGATLMDDGELPDKRVTYMELRPPKATGLGGKALGHIKRKGSKQIKERVIGNRNKLLGCRTKKYEFKRL